MSDPSQTSRFEIGEVAILIGSINWPEYNGQEVTVIGGLKPRSYWADRQHTRSNIDLRYLVEAADGHIFAAPPSRLRKRRPPQDWVRLCRLNEAPVKSDGVPA